METSIGNKIIPPQALPQNVEPALEITQIIKTVKTNLSGVDDEGEKS